MGPMTAAEPTTAGWVTAETHLDRLRDVVAGHGRVAVAFSGGADSALVARVAHDVLGPGRATAVTAVSPSLPAAELEHCARLAADWGLRWHTVPTTELDDPAYVANGADRCAHCKTALMDAIGPVLEAAGAGTVALLGVNLDDLGDHRPGQDVARARGAAFPLVAAGLTKADVREVSRLLGLPTWDRPQAACLASRIPHGTPVTVELLGRVERVEAGLRALGFAQLRVRDHGDTARIEVDDHDLARALHARHDIVGLCRAAGYAFAALDLEGFRSGKMQRTAHPATASGEGP